MQSPTDPTRKQPPPMICTYCGIGCDAMNATANTGRPAICTCCYGWFCEFCLHEHQRSPEYRNSRDRRFMRVPDRS